MMLYDFELSGNCYKIRLLLNLLKQNYESRMVDLLGGENRGKPFLQLNPKAEVPVLEDGELVIADSSAILVYLAMQYGQEHWLPRDPASQARIQFWLATASNEIQHGPAAARVIRVFGAPRDYNQAATVAAGVLSLIEQHLSHRDWLVADHISIADIAIYPYVALAEDGDIALDAYPHINQWRTRIEALPDYVPLPRATALA